MNLWCRFLTQWRWSPLTMYRFFSISDYSDPFSVRCDDAKGGPLIRRASRHPSGGVGGRKVSWQNTNWSSRKGNSSVYLEPVAERIDGFTIWVTYIVPEWYMIPLQICSPKGHPFTQKKGWYLCISRVTCCSPLRIVSSNWSHRPTWVDSNNLTLRFIGPLHISLSSWVLEQTCIVC